MLFKMTEIFIISASSEINVGVFSVQEVTILP